MDNTPQQQMRDERMNGIDGPRRLNPLPPAENTKLWEDFKAGKLGIDKASDGTVQLTTLMFLFYFYFFLNSCCHLFFGFAKVKTWLLCVYFLFGRYRDGEMVLAFEY